MEDLLAKIAVRDAKWAKEAELAKQPSSRAKLVAPLVITLKKGPGFALNEQSQAWQHPLEQYDLWLAALTSLTRLKVEEVRFEVVQFSDVNAFIIKPWPTSFPSKEDTNPAYGAIRYSGKTGIATFTIALAQQNRSDEFVRVAVQAINEIANPKRFAFATSGHPVLDQYAREYEQKAVRLRALTQYLAEPIEGEKPDETKVAVEVPTFFASNDQARVAQVLELHYALTDQLEPSTEEQVLAAITSAQKLKAFELAPDLCDKLDSILPPKVEPRVIIGNVLAFSPKGQFSPAIAEASEAALRSMGRDAIPALLDAASTYGRSRESQQKAMKLIFVATGSNPAARAALEQGAKVNDERAVRLRAIIESDKKPATK